MTGPALSRAAGATDPDARVPELVEGELAGYLAARRPECAAVHPAFAEAADTLTHFVLGGGKRVRPTFAWWGWRGAGGDPDGPAAGAVLRVISALELLQAAALVHDDLMDDSDSRRGSPTVHVRYAERHRRDGWPGTGRRFGAAAAILIGDLALAWADDMIDDSLQHPGLPGSCARQARAVWTAVRTEMLGGQFLDSWAQAGADTDADTALRIDRFKTAAYTVERPLHLGAALAGAPAELVDGYRRFGADIGVAFQLRDDLLGVFGDPAVTGKPAGDDLREGKRTLLIALALRTAREHGRDADETLLRTALGDPDLDDRGIDRIRCLMRELGADAGVEHRIERLTESGLAALAAAPVASPADVKLVELAHTATCRRY